MSAYPGVCKTGFSWSYIDPNNYTVSILQEGVTTGFVDTSALRRIQTQIFQLCQDNILKYTHGESTSVKKETAERILASIFYSLDTQLLSLANHENALQYLNSVDITTIYREGFRLVTSCIEETWNLYQHLVDSKLKTEIYAYNTTIDKTLAEFLVLYDPIYNAQEMWASIDYPLLLDDGGGQGIFYIKQYLKQLKFENDICNMYKMEDIDLLLANFGRVYCFDYREASFNITELVLTNAIFSVLSGNSALNLKITGSQYELLRESISGLDPSHYFSLINRAIGTLLDELKIEDIEIRYYIGKYASSLLPRLIAACENDNLKNIIITNIDNHKISNVFWNDGRKLSDNDFRIIVEEILTCSDGSSKADIIHAEIHSLSDFIDVLEADCLFDEEFYDLFMTLGDVELSILVQIVCLEELRTNQAVDLRNIIGAKSLDAPWQQAFARFLLDLDNSRIDDIKQMIPPLY